MIFYLALFKLAILLQLKNILKCFYVSNIVPNDLSNKILNQNVVGDFEKAQSLEVGLDKEEVQDGVLGKEAQDLVFDT